MNGCRNDRKDAEGSRTCMETNDDETGSRVGEILF